LSDSKVKNIKQLLCFLLVIWLASGCTISTSQSSSHRLSKQEFIAEIVSLSKFDIPSLDNRKQVKQAKLKLSAKIAKLQKVIPPTELAELKSRFLATMSRLSSVYSQILSQGSNFDQSKGLKQIWDIQIDLVVLSNWIPLDKEKKVSGKTYFQEVKKMVIDEDQPAVSRFNVLLNQNENEKAIIVELDKLSQLYLDHLQKLKRLLPPKKFQKNRRQMIKIYLLNLKSNHLYRQSLISDNPDEVKLLAKFALTYQQKADELQVSTLENLSTYLGKDYQWEFN
jgi:hypothetical protein